MASCQTSQWKSTAPYVKLTISTSSTSSTAVTYSWLLQYIASDAANTSVAKEYNVTINTNPKTIKSGTFNIDGKTGTHTIASGTFTINKTTSSQNVTFGVSFGFNLSWSGVYKGTLSATSSFTVPSLPQYQIKYDDNGGSGAPSQQLKWHGTAITLSSTKPTRTGYTFKGWGTSSTATTVSYAAGASYTANATVTLYAIWTANTYTVKYDANGGTGAPGNQTKTHAVTLKLSSTKPTRTNYTFKGWGRTATATTVSYAPGSNYTGNAGITLYAVWELAYIAPRITNLSVTRCDSSGNANDEGMYALVAFNWATDKAITEIAIQYEDESGYSSVHVEASVSGTSGSYSGVIGGSLDVEQTYALTIMVTDSSTSYAFATLGSARFAIDFKAGGKGAAFGKTAVLDNVLDIAYQTRFFGGILPPVLEPEIDLNDIRTPNTYIGANISHNNYVNCPVTSGTFVLVVESCGEDGQVKQTYISCSKYKPERYSRFYYQGEWGDWFWSGTDEVVLYENSSGSNGTITLSASLANYRYAEIYFTDNNGKSGGYTKVWSPHGKTICLNIVETSSTTSVIQRQTMYTLSSTTMTPNTTVAGYLQFNPSTKVISNSPVGTNYIKIVRVIGRA